MPESETATSDAVPPLVSAEWLAARLGDPALRLIDIRSVVDGGGRAAYLTAHIPGAVHSDYVEDGWRATRGMATGLLPEPEALAALLGGLGLGPDQTAVVISAGTSAGDFAAAARVYWTLRMAGHRRITILDGGMAAWSADPSRPVVGGPSRRPEAAPYPVAVAPAARAEIQRVVRALATDDAVLLDTRALAFFEGRSKSPQARVPGRLPGAFLLDHTTAWDAATGRLKDRDALAALVAPLPAAPVIAYCNTGHQAATPWFVLAELLGRPDVSLYDGSMSEWTEEPSRPVATGPDERRRG
ncbi:rhodanese-like domain-containing protein [Rhodoplanes sp. TEM]|uniref:Rhodanese-like domain-containing protein n=1 Tax=Rhodoplanes tepidamans TaxID=200616 RepID=A0ABT5JAQ6_RHOTP|nr:MULTISPECIES: rhodanese-like domain-containing protein [Rhodoplanes]MDC7786364.1 rhodanese-like domain-containing protein [Rhodoplanes tepidamans]MDC7985436.1 rhodanese-like domain-containing protein [Rhodoplanes sp. TEM]MDQ0354108.1 thiosulfate/3-mercaptopyruvate sulfurtransferase [Rhodoplanes tepidamans]